MDIFISIHAPVKGATVTDCSSHPLTTDFNPRTREGCDQDRKARAEIRRSISIHAPVKGATFRFHAIISLLALISIHAPVKGATNSARYTMPVQPHFNPRTREGCDDGTFSIFTLFGQISIHAPVKGATYRIVPAVMPAIGISIHAPVKGATITAAV